MKTSFIALAAIVALTGAAGADSLPDNLSGLKFPKAKITHEQSAQDLDYKSTGSIAPTRPSQRRLKAENARGAENGTPKLGINVSPWMMPVYH
jgi:hypothetical protein